MLLINIKDYSGVQAAWITMEMKFLTIIRVRNKGSQGGISNRVDVIFARSTNFFMYHFQGRSLNEGKTG